MKQLTKLGKNIVRLSIDSIIYVESFFHKKIKKNIINGSPQKRILIVRKDGLGDCIIFYPTLKLYRDYYRDAEITLIFPTYFKDLSPLLSKDLVDKVIWFDHKAFGSSFKYRRNFLLDLKRNGYDVFIYPVFTRETIGYFMMKMTGAKEKISFDGDISEHGKLSEKRGTLKYSRLIRPPETMKSELARDNFFAETITGKKNAIVFPTIDVNKLTNIKAKELIEKNNLTNKKYVVLFPGAGANYRIWMTKSFAEIADYIDSKGMTVVVCGSPKEKDLAHEIISQTKSANKIIDLSGQTDLATLAHILHKSIFYFGSDTGILHLASAIGTPAISIVGMGGLERFFPYGDLNKNRAVIDKENKYVLGAWTDFEKLLPGEIHPSIRNVKVEDAKKEIDSLLQYLA